ncbi:hypothetical protein CDL15_Pgr005438 [Punica granatum]|uniref:Uncharacterized protein n=1 Tax=Punica granatum TaxID=22663 RepID=A0A218WUF6_PUNGR|nr:hypothetical protein CDL15_Pgr005438 [Punica granatum]
MELAKLTLNQFNVSANRLDGEVPLVFNHGLFISSSMGNPGLGSPNLNPLPRCSKPGKGKLYIVAVLTICALVLLVSLTWFLRAKLHVCRGMRKSLWKITMFRRVGFSHGDLFNHLLPG